MTENTFPGGVWPVMLTPFDKNNAVDYTALEELINWYKKEGAQGLFAVCQSSEMFYLSLEERTQIARFVKEKAHPLPVIASGHIADRAEDQITELKAMSETGIDALILITNRLARQDESDEVWMRAMDTLLEALDPHIKLGLYECPWPYKRLLTPELLSRCAQTGRFYFLKDTSCDIDQIRSRLSVLKGSSLKLYNANTATLHESLKAGAAGFSGVMANTQCALYTKLCADYDTEDLLPLSDELTISALIERQIYPLNAKYYLARWEGLHMPARTRTGRDGEWNRTAEIESEAFRRLTECMRERWL